MKIVVPDAPSKAWHAGVLLGLAGLFLALAAYLYIAPLEYPSPDDRYRVVAAAGMLGLIVLYKSYTGASACREYSALKRLARAFIVKGRRVKVPSSEVFEGEASIVRCIYKGGYRTSIRVSKRKPAGERIDLDKAGPYLFKGRKTRRGRAGRSNTIVELEYRGPTYISTYRGREYMIIPLTPTYPRQGEAVLKALRGRDYAEARISIEENVVIARIYYSRNIPRGIRIEAEDRRYWGDGEKLKVLTVKNPGSSEHRIALPILEEPHLIIVPAKRRFLDNAEIYLGDFRHQGSLIEDNLILGFRDLGLRLVLDIPGGRDIRGGGMVALQ